MLEALREFTLVQAMSAARRQVAADLWTKPIGLNHKLATYRDGLPARTRVTSLIETNALPLSHATNFYKLWCVFRRSVGKDLQVKAFPANKQESPAIADKPARRESLPKIALIRRA